MATDDRANHGREPRKRSSDPRRAAESPRGTGRGGSGQAGGGPRVGGSRGGGSPRTGAPRTGAPRAGSQQPGERRPRGPGGGSDRRPDTRGDKPVKKGPPAPEIPEDVVYGQLDRSVRSRLRTLTKENAEDVGRHLIMAGLLMDSDPELAYRHAAVAAARGGRVDVVREAAALTAYATGRYAEALREFRTVRRLNGSSEHLPLMADCERGLGRPERAIALSQDPEANSLTPAGRIELAIVVAGARADMGEAEAALVALKRLTTSDPAVQSRIDGATADILRGLGRDNEADAIAPAEPDNDFVDDDVVVYDTFDEEQP